MTMHEPAQRALRQYIEQIEQLEAEKKAVADDIKEKFDEARSAGFDVKVMRRVLRMRRQTADERAEQAALLDTYWHALAVFDGTPMGAHIARGRELEAVA